MWTDADIMQLIKCPKHIAKKPKSTFSLVNRNWKNDCVAESDDGQYKFGVFARSLDAMPEDFSVGLKMDTPNPICEKTVILMRFQGPHGGYTEDPIKVDLHNDFHIHILLAEDISNRRYVPKHKIQATDYASFEEAINSFCIYCNLRDCSTLLLASYQSRTSKEVPGQLSLS